MLDPNYYLDARVGDIWDIEGTAWRIVVLVIEPLDSEGRAMCLKLRFWNDGNDETHRGPRISATAFVHGRKRSTLIARIDDENP